MPARRDLPRPPTLSQSGTSIRSILKTGLDRALLEGSEEVAPHQHADIRGSRYYHRERTQMFEALALARGDGCHERILKTIARMQVLIIDGWGLALLTAPERRDLLESSKTAMAALSPSSQASCQSSTGARQSAIRPLPMPSWIVWS